MNSPETQFCNRLKEKGLRITPDRLTVFRNLASTERPLSIASLAEGLQDQGINQATVYRTIELFTALGVVHPVLAGHDTVGYELIPPFRYHHHHLTCTQCGAITDLYQCGLDHLLQQIREREGYQITYHTLEVHGICPSCQHAKSLPNHTST